MNRDYSGPVCHPDLFWILTTMVKPGSLLKNMARPDGKLAELHALAGIQQDPAWHPEGDALEHTAQVVDAMQGLFRTRPDLADCGRGYQAAMLLAAVAHDMGKAVCTRWDDEKQKWTSYGHDVVGVYVARRFLISVEVSPEVCPFILALVRWHMSHCRPVEQWTERSVRKLLAALVPADLHSLALLMEADCRGRGTASSGLPASLNRLFKIAESLP